jgi:hypothetical protein
MEKLDKEDKDMLIESVPGGANNVEFDKKKSSTNINIYRASVDDRTTTRKRVQARLRKEKIKFVEKRMVSYSGEPITEFIRNKLIVRVVYKPKQGGMNETTLNSTITELVPCLMFHNNINATSVSKLQEELNKLKHENQKCYVNGNDLKSGKEFVEKFETSSKYDEKMKNAIAIYKFLCKTHKIKSIETVYWTYRAKPTGIPDNSPADIVIRFKDKELLGVSLKAGDATSKEPLLNTYIHPILEYLKPAKILALRKKLYTSVYVKVENIPSIGSYDKSEREITYENLDLLERTDEKTYNNLYDDALGIIRDELVGVLTESKTKFIDYVKYAILKESKVPVILIKATGTSYMEKKDSNRLKKLLPQISKIEVKLSATSKQNFDIVLKGRNGVLGTMEWSVRTNKTKGRNKLNQFSNMAVKYNGLR